TDESLRLTWVGNGSDRFVGIVAIPTGMASLPLANATLVSDPEFVWPNQYIVDVDRSAFLRRTDAGHHLDASPGSSDYGALVSVGPFDLVAGDSIDAVFAVVDGQSLAELVANADRARRQYTLGTAAVGSDGTNPEATIAMSVTPNPLHRDGL